jgi:excinuclease ABC subunit C
MSDLLSEPEKKIEDLREQVSKFPDAPGIYLFKNAFDTVLYVGKAVSIKKRVSSYFNKNAQDSPKIRSLVTQVHHLEFVVTTDESQAFLLESNLIKRYRPRYNVVLRDDKSYPYIKLTTREDFPRVLISRRPMADGSRYYGPFPNLKLREILKIIYRYFNIRDCDIDIDGKAERACLSYQIKQCPAPCIGAIDKIGYATIVDRVKWFLEGKHESLMSYLKGEMLKASERMEYEEAAKCRDLLSSIEQMQNGYAVITEEKLDLDVIALTAGLGKVLASVLQVRQGKVIDHVKLVLENELEQSLSEVLPFFLRQFYVPGVFVPDEILIARDFPIDPDIQTWVSALKVKKVTVKNADAGWRSHLMEIAERNALASLKEDLRQTEVLEELKKLLRLKNLPRNIACFDISNLQGTFNVGSAVFFKDGVPEKNRYRKFKIRDVVGQDDFKSHQEMMRRYLALVEREGNPLPDLFLIDGGKGQLSAVKEVLDRDLGGDYGLASLAKREEEVFLPGESHPVDFRGHLKARYLLQRVRDESHRFAVGYHRIIRDRNAVTSLLRGVKGIGPSRLRALLNTFESVDKVKTASLEELQAVPSFSKELATKLYQHFHSLG